MFLAVSNYFSGAAKGFQEGVRQVALTSELRHALRDREIEKVGQIFSQLPPDVLPKICFSAFYTAAAESDLGIVEVLASHTACKPYLCAITIEAVKKFPRNLGFFSLLTPHLTNQEKKDVALTALSQKELPLFRSITAEIPWEKRKRSRRVLSGIVEYGLFGEFSRYISSSSDLKTLFQIAFSHCHVHILTELVKREFLVASSQEANECLDAMRKKDWTKAMSALKKPITDALDLRLLLVHAAVYDREDLLKALPENKVLTEIDHAIAFALRVEANPVNYLDLRDQASDEEEESPKPNPLLQFCIPKWKRGVAAYQALVKGDVAETEKLLGEGEVYTMHQNFILVFAAQKLARGVLKRLVDLNNIDQEMGSITVLKFFRLGDFESGELLIKAGCVLEGERFDEAMKLAHEAKRKGSLRLLGEEKEREEWVVL